MRKSNNSRNLRGKALIKYKKSLKLTDLQREVLVGTLLGDASMPWKRDKPTYHIKFEQQIRQREYIQHLYEIFEPFVGTPPKIRNITGATNRQSIWFRTYSHPTFKFYSDNFYRIVQNRRTKCVPKNIHRMLTPRALAYWFMDDGTLSGQDYLFSTQNFSLSDQKILQRGMLKNFDIQINIHKDNPLGLEWQPDLQGHPTRATFWFLPKGRQLHTSIPTKGWPRRGRTAIPTPRSAANPTTGPHLRSTVSWT